MVKVDIAGDGAPDAAGHQVVARVVSSAVGTLLDPSHDRLTISIRIASDDEISELHHRYFDDPELTDVMSFPSGDDLDDPNRHLGDIAISLSVAGLQAAEHGHSVTREIAFLALHGLLHLLGYDDADDVRREHMMQVQSTLLDAFELEHGTI